MSWEVHGNGLFVRKPDSKAEYWTPEQANAWYKSFVLEVHAAVKEGKERTA